ncbi:15869_t:CDS:2, partial [Gigaspora rosea]
MSKWKYSKERLIKHEFCAHIINSKRVETEWDSDIYDNMDDDDLLPIDETNEIEKKNIKFTSKFYWENSALKNYLQNIDLRDIWNLLNNDNEDQTSNPWIILANKAINGAFKDSPIFLELCKVMSDAAEQKAKNKGKQNMKYNEAFTNFLVILRSISPRALDLFRQNLEGRDNTKLKLQLKYFSTIGCIIGSVLLKEETHISIYSDIPNVIANIKSSNRVTKAVRTYLLQIPLLKFPLVVIVLIPNKGSDTARDIEKLYRKLAQQSILNTQTSKKLTICEPDLNISFSCSILDGIGPIIRVQDPKYAKKTAQNAIMSGARLLTFGNSSNDGELIDRYLNRDIAPIEHIRIAVTAYFFLHLWKFHIETLASKYSDFVSVRTNFLSHQRFAIFISLAELIILLVKAHHDFYPQIPLLSWFHGSEACEHFFACELTESIGMIQPADLSINENNLLISMHEEEVSASYIYSDTNSADIQEIDDISFAISNALKEVEQLSNNLNDDDNFLFDNIFQNGQRQ